MRRIVLLRPRKCVSHVPWMPLIFSKEKVANLVQSGEENKVVVCERFNTENLDSAGHQLRLQLRCLCRSITFSEERVVRSVTYIAIKVLSRRKSDFNHFLLKIGFTIQFEVRSSVRDLDVLSRQVMVNKLLQEVYRSCHRYLRAYRGCALYVVTSSFALLS